MVEIVPLVVGCLGEGMKKLGEQVKLVKEKISTAMRSKRNAKDRTNGE